MNIIELKNSELNEIGIVDSFKSFNDERGSLSILSEGQERYSLKTTNSIEGVFRGMHYQAAPYEQKKIIKIQSGLVREFVVDSKKLTTIYTWMFDEKMGWLEIPSNYYHGYYVINKTNFIYMCLGEYSEPHEKQINITKVVDKYFCNGLIMSEKDKSAKEIKNV